MMNKKDQMQKIIYQPSSTFSLNLLIQNLPFTHKPSCFPSISTIESILTPHSHYGEPQTWGEARETVEPYAYCHRYFGYCHSITVQSHFLMLKLVTENIPGSNDWREGILVAKYQYSVHLYKFFMMIKDFSCKQIIYARKTLFSRVLC